MARIRTALIIDDDEDILSLCKVTFRAFTEWNVKLASSRDAALRAAQELPDVILLDIMMPGIDGLCLLDELRRSERTAQIPVVLMTAGAAEATECKRRGATGLIPKPFDPSTLHDRITQLLEER
jgi:CheY-like chemotaxis protein